MGVVFEARDPALDRAVAIKVLRPEAATAAAAARFTREARLLARLSHPNVVPVYQVGESDGLFWFAMARVRGETLAGRLQRGPLPPEEAVRVGRDLLGALAAAHELGIIHRDLKPANVFLEGGRALLADFGIARTATADPDGVQTRTTEVIGTPAYMSPEQMGGDTVSPATDLYALGLVLYECLTGKRWPPLQTASTADWTGVPAGLIPALRRTLAGNPAERWPDAESFARALSGAPSRARWIWGAGAVAAGLGAWLLLGPARDAAEPAGPNAPGTAVTPRAGEARRAWLRAEGHYRAGRWREADSLYLRALALDSTCLACEVRRIDLAHWVDQPPDSGGVVRLRAGVAGFSPRWRGLVEALVAPAHRRLDRLEALTENYRDFTLAWYQLGEELYNRGSLFGRRRREAIEALETVAHLDSAFAPLWYDLTLARIAEGDSAGSAQSLERLLALPRAQGLAQAQREMAALAFAFRFTPNGLGAWQAMAQSAGLEALPELAAGPRVLLGLGSPAGAVALGQAFEADARSGPVRRSGLLAQVFGHSALGRPGEARAVARRLLAAFPSVVLDGFAASLGAALVILDQGSGVAELRDARAALEPFTRTALPPPVRREAAWLLGLAALRLGDRPGAARYVAQLTGDPVPRHEGAFLTAAIAAAAGQLDSAISITDPLVQDLEGWDRAVRSPLLRAALRLTRARWFEVLQVPENARTELRWHQHFHLSDFPVGDPTAAEGDWAFAALASWRQARVLDRGEPDADVCAAYALVAGRWSEGEPRYRARADTARTRVTELGCGAVR